MTNGNEENLQISKQNNLETSESIDLVNGNENSREIENQNHLEASVTIESIDHVTLTVGMCSVSLTSFQKEFFLYQFVCNKMKYL